MLHESLGQTSLVEPVKQRHITVTYMYTLCTFFILFKGK